MKSSKPTERASETSLRKRRGVLRASVTHLNKRVGELEGRRGEDPATFGHAQRALDKLENLDTEFKGYHFELLDLIDDEEALQAEQDEHDDNISQLYTSIKSLIASFSPVSDPNEDTFKL